MRLAWALVALEVSKIWLKQQQQQHLPGLRRGRGKHGMLRVAAHSRLLRRRRRHLSALIVLLFENRAGEK